MKIIHKDKLIKLLERSGKKWFDDRSVTKLIEEYGDRYAIENGELVLVKVNTKEV